MRDSQLYAELRGDVYRAVGLAEGFVEPSTDDPEVEVLTAWQVLHDTGRAYQLQGFFGRTAQRLIADGLIEGDAQGGSRGLHR